MNPPTMSTTVRLLRVLGSPLISAPETPVEEDEVMELYDYSVANRLPLYYLHILKKQGKLGKLDSEYEAQIRKQRELLGKVTTAYHLFKSNRIDNIVFKTIRPCPVIPTDIDILLVNSSDYGQAAALLRKIGYFEEAGKSPEGKHFRPPGGGIFIDIRPEIALSHIIYMDKNKLLKYVTKARLNGKEIQVFSPEVELAIVAAHSVINEEVYTIQDYYLGLSYLVKMNSGGVNRFLHIVKENHITRSATCHFAITAILHEAAHGMIPDGIRQILGKLGDEKRETVKLIKNNLKLPHKFSLLTVAKTIMEKAHEAKARRSLAVQIAHMLNPSFARAVWLEVRKMRTRERW